MHEILPLVRNETTKLWKQTFYKVLVILLLCAIVLYPIGCFFMNLILEKSINRSVTPERVYENHMEYAGYDEDAGYPVDADYYRTYANATLFFSEQKVENWKFRIYFYNYAELCLCRQAYLLLREETFGIPELMGSSYGQYLSGGPILEEYNEETYETTYSRNPEFDLAEGIASLNVQISDYESMLLTATATELLTREMDGLKEEKTMREQELADSRASLSLYPSDPNLIYQTDYLEEEVQNLETLIGTYTVLIRDGRDFDSWQYNTVTLLKNLLQQKLSTVVEPETLAPTYLSYEEYLESKEKERARLKEVEETVLYSIEKNISIPYLVDDSKAASAYDLTATMVGWMSLCGVLMAGMIVASEHANGTIRLLLIRPKKRWKILLSKYLAVLFYTGALMLIAFVVSILFSAVAYRGNDLFTPVLRYGAGGVYQIPAGIYLLLVFVEAALPVLLYTTIAFFFSTLFRHSVLAVGMAFLCSALSGIMQLVSSVMIYMDLDFVKATIFPYLDLPSLRFSVTDIFCKSNQPSGVMDLLFGASSELSLSAGVGILLFLLHTAFFAAMSFLSFQKNQIKS